MHVGELLRCDIANPFDIERLAPGIHPQHLRDASLDEHRTRSARSPSPLGVWGTAARRCVAASRLPEFQSVHSSRPFESAGPLRSIAYRALWNCANLLGQGANACLYLAAGMLRADDLRAASQERWRVDGFSNDDVDLGLAPWERRLYGDVLRRSDRVLLVGCGTGRDLVALLESGYDVSGLDQSLELVALARQNLARRGKTATVDAGLVETYRFDATYDVVILAGGCYSYVQHSAVRVATLARIQAHMNAGGRVVLTYGRLERQSALSIALVRLGTVISRAGWRPEPGDSFSRDHVARRVLRYEHLFRPGEVARECADAGLRMVREERVGGRVQCVVAIAD